MHFNTVVIVNDLTPAETAVLELIEPAEVCELLQALIRCRSDYPPGDTRAAIELVADRLAAVSIRYEIVARQEHQPNLIASLGPETQRPRLMFHAHIDTVAASDRSRWSVDPFSGELKDGCIFGRGAGAPQEHSQCQRPSASHETAGWWLRRAVRRRVLVLMSGKRGGRDG